MNKRNILKGIMLLCRIGLGAVFFYAGWKKIQDPLEFADAIAGFEVLPPFLINLMALWLPILEMISAVLILGVAVRQGAFSILMMSLLFVAATGQALLRGLEVDCGCLGPGEASLGMTFLRAVALLLVSGWIYTSQMRQTTKSVRECPVLPRRQRQW